MSPSYNLPLAIKPVTGRYLQHRFIKIPWDIYQDDPAWVPPLIMDINRQFDSRNPYFSHARIQSWIAFRGTQAVGRISAQIDRLHLEHHHEQCGFFGLLEAEDRLETFATLLNTAHTWLKERGMKSIMGPFNLSINHECGLLTAGFDTPPYIMMGHAKPYYSHRIIAQGFSPVKELLAYQVKTDFTPPRAMLAITRRVKQHIQIRPLNRSRFDEEIQIIGDIFNDAWSNNWGFIPMTKAELESMGRDLKLLVNKQFIQIAEVDGKPAAMIIVLPNINEIITDLNGHLLPLGWMKLLWRLKVKHPETARVALMGIRKKYQHQLIGAALAFMVIDAARYQLIKKGVTDVEMSWILEDNLEMRKILETIGSRISKRYTIYRKEI
ncbi:MAG: N-acetyltransferase [Pseudomonadota bacterium]|nr:N-acetyltransferase [Pseudomonadota bacterium]